jgi:flagellar protein FlaG
MNTAMVSPAPQPQDAVVAPRGTVRQTSAGNEAQPEAAAIAAKEQAKQEAASPTSVKESVKQLNDMMRALNRSVQFSVDDETRINLVKIVDVNSKEVIRQIPSEEVVRIAQAIDEQLKGLLLKEKA